MPLSPPSDSPGPNPRLDPYRERAGLLFRDGAQVATLYLRAETYWQQIGGHLWWRRWSAAREAVHGYLQTVDGGFDDFVFEAEDLANQLDDWDGERFRYRGETLQVRWLPDAETRRLGTELFDLD